MTRRRRRPVLAAVAALAALAVALPAAARAPVWADLRPFSEQTQFFRAVLHELGIQPISSLQKWSENATGRMVIILGGNAQVDRLLPGDELRQFREAGGAILFASDQPTSAHLSNQLGGVGIEGPFLRAQPSECYRGTLEDCPLVREHRRGATRHPIFRDLPESAVIATNRPGRISVWWTPLAPVARISTLSGSFNDRVGGRWRIYPNQAVLAVAGEYPSGGRLLVVADHSLFINGMLQQPDNDNLLFAMNVVRWLSEDGKRTEALFLDSGMIQPSFRSVDVQAPLPPLPPLDNLLPRVNSFIRAIEQEDALNKALLQMVPHASWLRGAAVALTVGLISAGVFRFLGSRHRAETRKAKPALMNTDARGSAHIGSSGSSGHLDSFRHVEFEARSAARDLARAAWEDVGVPVTGGAAPAATVAGGWFARRHWQRRARRRPCARARRSAGSAAGGRGRRGSFPTYPIR
jgi:hypothetical protein